MLALGLLAGCRSAPLPPGLDAVPLALTTPFQVPLLDPGRPIVALSVEGHADLSFLLDSGSQLSLIDAAQAAELGLPRARLPRRIETVGSGGRSSFVEDYTTIAHAELGPLALDGFRVQLLDDPAIRDAGCFGILGQDLLARLPWILDLEREAVHFLPPDAGVDGVRTYLGSANLGAGAWAVAELEFRPSPFLALDVAGLPEASVELEIDTGSSTTSLPRPAIDALGLESTGTTTFQGIGGMHEEEGYALENFDFYGLKVSMPVHSSPLAYGLLGTDFFGQIVLVLDGPSKRAWFHNRRSTIGNDR